MKGVFRTTAIVVALVAWPSLALRVTTQAPAADKPVDARIWIGQAAAIEDYLRTVPMLKFEDLGVGVTKSQRAFLPEGGAFPFKYLAWKVIPPGRSGGYWESYQNEIAAYEMDKLLGLNMVPPVVDRTYRGQHGAAIMWVSPTKSFKDLGGPPTPPAELADAWTRQLVKAKMFHNLVNDIDPNLGNWLVDPAWDLILIDCSRCFTPDAKLFHALTRVDPDLWARMQSLTEPQLTPALGKLMGKDQVKGILKRRDEMQVLIDKLVKERGETYVFMKDIGK
jgi:hypothetical protein